MPAFELQFPARQISPLAARFPYVDDTRMLAVGAAVRERGRN
jgi:hypothetical protein